MPETENNNSIWNRDFTILTVGTVISNVGYAVMSFVSSMLLLEISGSVALYSLYQIIYCVIKITVPILAGPYLDNFSRRKTIFIMDYLTAGVYFVYLLLLRPDGTLPVFILLLGAIIFGMISSLYTVAYNSLYPMLVRTENYQKAYSISVILADISFIAYPAAAIGYRFLGNRTLIMLGILVYLAAATVETFIRVKEDQIQKSLTGRQYLASLKDGLKFARKNSGLLFTSLGFLIANVMIGIQNTLWLPFFHHTFQNGYLMYIVVTSTETIGVFWGSVLIYKVKVRQKAWFFLWTGGTLLSLLIESFSLIVPWWFSAMLLPLAGFVYIIGDSLASASMNQVLENDMRGRYSGINIMAINIGLLLGELISGAFGDVFPQQEVNLFAGLVIFTSFFVVVVLIGGRKVKNMFDESGS